MGQTSTIKSLRLLLRDFAALRETQRQGKLRAMDVFLRTYGNAQHQRTTDFNLFTVLGIDTDEVRQSSVLAWLLGGGHGLRTAFLESFIQVCALRIPSTALDRYRVQTEFSGAEARIDLMVYRRAEFLNSKSAPHRSASGRYVCQCRWPKRNLLPHTLCAPTTHPSAIPTASCYRNTLGADQNSAIPPPLALTSKHRPSILNLASTTGIVTLLWL